ncbi:hypothetical protein DE146DRAFT_476356 [Phaeosphaeria sp. MPI-PUGE-AT-0046c]|nr:hypothetical protein DE146DRAFT_476356 [Phaeosphaeria sp. MPI-PUGE-AT-0046c]
MSQLERTLMSLVCDSKNPQIRHLKAHVPQFDESEQLNIVRQLLCIRSPDPPLPEKVVQDVDQLLLHSRDQRILTLGASIPSISTLQRPGLPDIQIKLWQGDITTLASDVNAITNAANSAMLGCFQPSHKCIDNVIHSVAGPRLRQECFDVMEARSSELPAGEALVTKGYCLPSPYVIHTVGPQLDRGKAPTSEERQQLRQCYVSVLEQAEGLPSNPDGSKRVAFCGISTGLFAFPTAAAAKIATDTVLAWLTHHEDTSITEVIFNTFAEGDIDIYTGLLTQVPNPWSMQLISSPIGPQFECSTLFTAQKWLASASNILISAGAGLSAADGLDYNSKALFKKNFSSFIPLGLNTLYSAIGFPFPSEQVQWAYFFHNATMIRGWPGWPTYQALLSWLKASGKNVHIRTSNADGVFLHNGWDEENYSTPQGRYSVLQCLRRCRPDSTWPTAKYYEAALPHLPAGSQKLTDKSKVPRCPNCSGPMMICVRGGNWFNETPFKSGETSYRNFRRDVLGGDGSTVVLELGVGMNTPGVLRWPNEDLVRKGGGKVKLVRMGVGPAMMVPGDLEQKGLAVCVEGDIKYGVPALLEAPN